ncbi:MAG TPA: spermidine/putrescine ABC transporter ATP-binding protein, partial [Acidimicrobiaceae bacterium]|nr:spermidine/putrescine ABC transporter ATP-binding protein [Acidimicrobiaceae bacterium]
TTTLRMLGGFEAIEHGSIRIDGVDMGGVPPERRPVNTVFQSYALFPHRTVADNVAFGLRFLDVDKVEARRRVAEALSLVRLEGLERRRPHQLSGGQQQRVALARSLVLRPKVLLLDEPLGALDAKLRRTLQDELRALHREVGITFVYVTHDQEEALTMSDRLAVMNAGRVEQVGTPHDVYDMPVSTYVADFLGLANLVPAHANGGGVDLLGASVPTASSGVVGDCTVLLRPERIRIVALDDATIGGTVTDVVFAGPVTHVTASVLDQSLHVVLPNDGSPLPSVGDHVGLLFSHDSMRVLAP